MVNDIFKGSLQVTSANEPARFYTIKSAALWIFWVSLSNAKSFSTNSLVVINAIVTDLSTTGGKISTIDESTALLTIVLSLFSQSGNHEKCYISSGDIYTFEAISYN